MSVAHQDSPCVLDHADACTTQCSLVSSSAATESAFDDFLRLLVTCGEGIVGPPNEDTCCQSASSPVAARTLPCKETGKHKLNRQRPVRFDHCKPVHSRPVCRIISNDTYLRRLHLSPRQIIALVPSLASSLVPLATSRNQRHCVDINNLRRQVNIVNESGQSWTVVCECVLSANKKQLHCRMGPGWAQFCRDNSAAVYDKVVMMRDRCGLGNVLVQIEKKKHV